MQAAPTLHRTVPIRSLGGEFPSAEVLEGYLVRGDHPSAGAHLDAHVADGHAAFHRKAADGAAGKFDEIPRASACSQAGDDVQNDVLGANSFAQLAFHPDAHGLGTHLEYALRGEYHFHLAGAYPEGDAAQGAVRGGVAIPAHDGHAGLGKPCLRADDVDDAVAGRPYFEDFDAVFGAVFHQGSYLGAGLRVARGEFLMFGGDVVVRSGRYLPGAEDGDPPPAKPFESLRAGYLVDVLAVDVQNVRAAFDVPHYVSIPYFVE